jgi:hypothetical protein
MNSGDHTGQWLSQSRVGKGCVATQAQHVFFDEARWDNNRLGVSAIEKQQIIAKILLAVLTIETFAARGGIGHDHAVAQTPTFNSRSDLGDDAGQLMTKASGWHNHPGMIAAFKDFEIGATGQGRLNREPHLAGIQSRGGDLFDHYLFFAMEHSRFHVVQEDGLDRWQKQMGSSEEGTDIIIAPALPRLRRSRFNFA